MRQRCPACLALLDVPPEAVGKRIHCPDCKAPFQGSLALVPPRLPWLPWAVAAALAVALVVGLVVVLTRKPATATTSPSPAAATSSNPLDLKPPAQKPNETEAKGPKSRKDFEKEVLGVEVGQVRGKYGAPREIEPTEGGSTFWYYDNLTFDPATRKPDQLMLIVTSGRVREVNYLRPSPDHK